MSKENIIYVLGCKEFPNRLKIEYTDDFEARFSHIDKQIPYDAIVYYKRYTSNAKIVESVIHHIFRKFQVPNKFGWFDINDKSIVIEEINDVILFFENKD